MEHLRNIKSPPNAPIYVILGKENEKYVDEFP